MARGSRLALPSGRECYVKAAYFTDAPVLYVDNWAAAHSLSQ
jgi:hypothetical protein